MAAVDVNRIKYIALAGSFPGRLNHRRSTWPIRRDYVSIESSKIGVPALVEPLISVHRITHFVVESSLRGKKGNVFRKSKNLRYSASLCKDADIP